MQRAAAVVVSGLLLLGCAAGSEDPAEEPSTGEPATSEPSSTEPAAELGGAPEVLAAVEDSVVFLETPVATGSGIVVADGYVLTNAHVIDPLGAVDVTFADGTTVRAPVAGTDLLGDLAVVGPIDEAEDAPALEVVDEIPPKGDDVYLVGYPGEVDEAPEVTISAGIVSRVRSDDEFDLRYIQTDAAIGGGQSGGALVDARGRVIGISGLGGFAESFALVLSGRDVRAARERIDDGTAAGIEPFPVDPADTEGVLVVDDELDEVVLVAEGRDGEPLRLELDGDVADAAVDVTTLDGERAWANEVSIDLRSEAEDDPDADELFEGLPEPDRLEEVDGAYEVALDDGDLVQIVVTPATEGEVRWSTNRPVADVTDRDPVPVDAPLELGRPVDGVIRAGELFDVYAVELEAGDEIDVRAVAPNAGDPWVTVVEPGGSYWETDALEGLPSDTIFEVGTDDRVRAEESGTHLVVVESGDGLATRYRLTVSEA